MEDWHLGKELTDRKLRNSEGYERGVNAEKALTNFAANSDFVRSRGLITTKKEHRLEAARVPNDVPLDIVPLLSPANYNCVGYRYEYCYYYH